MNMMKCDRCGRVYNPDDSVRLQADFAIARMDLCRECQDSLKKWTAAKK